MLHRPASMTAAVLVILAASACTSGTSDERSDGGPQPRGQPTTQPQSSESSQSAPEPTRAEVLAGDGAPRRALLSIPAISLRALAVLPYRGSPDDGPGTVIQDGGKAASPFGPKGGTGPGGIGNYLVTAHRTSSTQAFLELPSLARGDRVSVVVGRKRFVYRITGTRTTSFRSGRSLARQSAAVPGRPGRRPTRAMITLSTCATQEDHAAGNYWSDEFGNPEHRIDKIGALVAVRPARGT